MSLRAAVCFALGLLTTAPAARAQQWELRIAMDDAAYRSAVSAQEARGLHVVDQAIYDAGDGTPRYAALWRDDVAGAPAVRWGLGADAFHRASIAVVDQGYRTADIVAGVVGGGPLYGGRWVRPNDRRHGTRYWQSAAQLRQALKNRGMRILSVAPFVADGRLYLASAFEDARGTMTAGLIDADEAKLRRTDRKYRARGYTLMQVRGWSKGKKPRYAALWRKEDGVSPYSPAPHLSTLHIVHAPLSGIAEMERGFRAQGLVPGGFSILPGETPSILVWTLSD